MCGPSQVRSGSRKIWQIAPENTHLLLTFETYRSRRWGTPKLSFASQRLFARIYRNLFWRSKIFFTVLMWEVYANGAPPYKGISNLKVWKKVAKEQFHLKPPDKAPQVVAQLMNKCWEQNPNRRPTFATIREELVIPEKKKKTAFQREKARKTSRKESRDEKARKTDRSQRSHPL